MSEPVVADSAGVTIVQFPADAIEHPAPFRIADAPELRLGVMDGEEAFSFARIVGAFRTPEGEIVVLDDRGPPLRRFGPDGTLLHTAGSRGEGPGELQAPRALLPAPDGGSRIWDQRTQRFVRIDADGTTLSDQPALPELPGTGLAGLSMPETPVAEAPGSVLAVYDRTQMPSGIPESGIYASDAVVLTRDPSGVIDTVAATPGGETELDVSSSSGGLVSIGIGMPWFRRRAHTAPVTDGLWFSHGAAWEAIRFGPDGVRTIVRFDREPDPFDAAFRQAILDDLLDGVDDSDQAARIRSAHQGREWPETVPPIRALFADELDRLWIGLGEGPAEALPGQSFPGTTRYAVASWLLLEPGGTGVVGRLSLPPRSAPLHADGAGVLLLVVDDLDVPYVEWRPFVVRSVSR